MRPNDAFMPVAALAVAVLAVAVLALAVLAAANEAGAQVEVPPARAPCSVLSDRPCHPSFCGVFHAGPCFPQYLPPIGRDLRLTIVSNDDNGAPAAQPGEDRSAASDQHMLDSIREMYAALRECWVPPPKDEAHHGVQYTIRFAFKRDGDVVAPPRMTYASHDASAEVRSIYRDAIDAALKRCTPLHFSAGMGDAVAGRPIAIRFVDDRNVGDSSGK